MPRSLPVHADRFAQALAAEGLDLPRHQVGRLLAAALGYRDHNALSAAARRGDLDPPMAGNLGPAASPDGAALQVLFDPVASLPYAVAASSLSSTDRRRAFGLTPYGNVVDLAGTTPPPRGVPPLAHDDMASQAHGREGPDAVLRQTPVGAEVADVDAPRLGASCGPAPTATGGDDARLGIDGRGIGREVSERPDPDGKAWRVEVGNLVGFQAVRLGKGPLSAEAIEAAIDLASDPEVARVMDLRGAPDPQGRVPSRDDALTVAFVVHDWDRRDARPLDDDRRRDMDARLGAEVLARIMRHAGERVRRVRFEVAEVTRVIDAGSGRLLEVVSRGTGERLVERAFDMSQTAESRYVPDRHQRGTLPMWKVSPRPGDLSHVSVRHGPLEEGRRFAEWTLASRREEEPRKVSAILDGEGAASFVTGDGITVSGPEVVWDLDVNWAALVATFPMAASAPGPSVDVFLTSRWDAVADAGGHLVVGRVRDGLREVRAMLPLETFADVPVERWAAVARAVLDADGVTA